MNLPSLAQAQDFITKVRAAAATITNSKSTVTDDIKAALPAAASILGTALDVYFPQATILGFPASKLLATATDLATAKDGPATPLTAAFGEIEAAVKGGAAPSDADWEKFNARADFDHNDWKSALAAA